MNTTILAQNKDNADLNGFTKGSINSDVLLELAVETANNQNHLKALEMAREALIFANKQGDYTKVYIHAFMAVIYIDLLNTEQARWHIWKALNSLNENHFAFNTDYEYISALSKKLKTLEANGKQMEILTLAA